VYAPPPPPPAPPRPPARRPRRRRRAAVAELAGKPRVRRLSSHALPPRCLSFIVINDGPRFARGRSVAGESPGDASEWASFCRGSHELYGMSFVRFLAAAAPAARRAAALGPGTTAAAGESGLPHQPSRCWRVWRPGSGRHRKWQTQEVAAGKCHIVSIGQSQLGVADSIAARPAWLAPTDSLLQSSIHLRINRKRQRGTCVLPLQVRDSDPDDAAPAPPTPQAGGC